MTVLVETTEQKTLKMHSQLLLDVIKRQAGTLEKAILEGVMNSIEAGGTRVDIEFFIKDGQEQTAFLKIFDDGRGIMTEHEILEHFEKFGTPHEENENKTWAQFRMGRGQLFAFGRNLWRTSTFEMLVDVNTMGLNYELTKNLPFKDGCNIDIELYENPIGSWTYPSIDSLEEQVRSQIEFVDIPIYFNGKRLNHSPQDLDWTMEDENAYYLFNVGEGLKIYNLGAFVKSVPTYKAGTSGVIVSKKQLKVNFARNDIQSDCEVFKDIQEIIKQNRVNDSRKKNRRLTDYERAALVKDFRDGIQSYSTLRGRRIFRTSNGKWYSMNMILDNQQPWTFAPEGSRIADAVMQREEVLCLSDNILNNLNYTGEKSLFFQWLLKNLNDLDKKYIQSFIDLKNKRYVPYGKNELKNTDINTQCLEDGFSSKYTVLPQNKLTIVEKRVLSALQFCNCWQQRTLSIGTSDEALAWTDGTYQITIDRTWLRNLNLNVNNDIIYLFSTLCHELAHDNETEGTHVHGETFYEKFHDIVHSKYSPISFAINFSKKMKNTQLEEQKAKIIAKQNAREDEIKAKLGIC